MSVVESLGEMHICNAPGSVPARMALQSRDFVAAAVAEHGRRAASRVEAAPA